jgi:outer membrane lipoprotein-sorting protein
MTARRVGLFVVGLLAVSAGLVFGLGALTAEEAPADPSFGENASVRLAELDGLTATRETVRQQGNRTVRTVERVSIGFDTGSSRAQMVSGPGDAELRVSNGSMLWLYDRENRTATRFDINEPVAAGRLDHIDRLLAGLNVTPGSAEGTTVSNVGVSPLPVVPAGKHGQTATEPAGDRGAIAVTSPETTTIDGRKVVAVRLEPSDRETEPVANFTQTLWLDAEWYYPLKQRTTWRQGGQRRAVTTTYRNVTFNPGLNASTFRFDPPAGTTVEVPDTPEQQRYESLAALRADATLSVPEPAIPDSFALVRATQTTGRITSIGLRYVNSTGVLTVAKLSPAIEPRSEGESVQVGEQQAVYRNLGPRQVVTWSCEDVQYKIGGSGVTRERLLAVAASVACE